MVQRNTIDTLCGNFANLLYIYVALQRQNENYIFEIPFLILPYFQKNKVYMVNVTQIIVLKIFAFKIYGTQK